MYTAKILNAKEDFLSNGEAFLDVELAILKDKKQVDVKKYGFPVDATEKHIKSQMKRVIALYNKEMEMAVLDAKKQEQKKKTNETINKLKGETL